MRHARAMLVAAILGAGIGLAGGAAIAAGKGPVQMATGSGHFDILGELRTFAFTARRDATGVTTGQAQINNRNQDIFSHIVIDCLHVDGNEATMSGYVASSSDPNVVGLPGIWRVIDNGEGSNAAPDQVSLFFFSNIQCTADVGIPMNDVRSGNVKVH